MHNATHRISTQQQLDGKVANYRPSEAGKINSDKNSAATLSMSIHYEVYMH